MHLSILFGFANFCSGNSASTCFESVEQIFFVAIFCRLIVACDFEWSANFQLPSFLPQEKEWKCIISMTYR